MSERDVVMIVDDTPANIDVLEEILSEHGFKVIAFPRGDLAVKASATSPPDLILMDVMMPVMNGFEVCRRIKEIESLQEIPVIFISALDDLDSKVKAFSEGGVDFITKPFQEGEVLARINAHINIRKMQQKISQYNQSLEAQVQEQVKEISDSQMSTLVAISKLAELRDEYTGKHVERTQIFCRLLAEELRKENEFKDIINDEYIKNIYYAASLHDVGKIGIPDQILLKKGRLEPDEFEVMKTHAEIGRNALQEVLDKYSHNEFIKLGLELTASHHEKWDGTGYPGGLSGEEIPLSARIMALVDVYDALRSRRPYKDPLSHKVSVDIIKKDSGIHFDPAVVFAFMKIEGILSDLFDQMQEEENV